MLRKRNRFIAICYLVILLINSFAMKSFNINAEVKFGGTDSVTSIKGDTYYEPTNKKATNTIVYGTLGWIIRFDQVKGNSMTLKIIKVYIK